MVSFSRFVIIIYSGLSPFFLSLDQCNDYSVLHLAANRLADGSNLSVFFSFSFSFAALGEFNRANPSSHHNLIETIVLGTYLLFQIKKMYIQQSYNIYYTLKLTKSNGICAERYTKLI